MKVFVFSWLLIGQQVFASDSCPPSTTVYRCENILSSDVKGRQEDKVTSANYRIWIQGEDSESAMRIVGKASSSALSGTASFVESDLPQTSKPMGALSSQDLVVKECEWRLSETFAQQVLKRYSNYPSVHDRYNMNLKNSELTVSMPVGIESFATFKLSCTKENK